MPAGAPGELPRPGQPPRQGRARRAGKCRCARGLPSQAGCSGLWGGEQSGCGDAHGACSPAQPGDSGCLPLDQTVGHSPAWQRAARAGHTAAQPPPLPAASPQATSPGSIISFITNNSDLSRIIVEETELFKITVSFGNVLSLIRWAAAPAPQSKQRWPHPPAPAARVATAAPSTQPWGGRPPRPAFPAYPGRIPAVCRAAACAKARFHPTSWVCWQCTLPTTAPTLALPPPPLQHALLHEPCVHPRRGARCARPAR